MRQQDLLGNGAHGAKNSTVVGEDVLPHQEHTARVAMSEDKADIIVFGLAGGEAVSHNVHNVKVGRNLLYWEVSRG